MIFRPSYARITLALDIIRKLEDGPLRGFHELAIIKHLTDLHDTVGVEEWPETAIECRDPAVPRDAANVCWRAAEALARLRGIDTYVKIHIDKRLPVQGGLAGGSSNAAATLLLLNELWGLELTTQELLPVARLVGMDVPYYLMGATAFDSEAGGVLRPVPTSLAFHFVIVLPDFGVSTRGAYRTLDYARTGASRAMTAAMERAFIAGDGAGVLRSMHNDFEHTVFAAYPELAAIRCELLAAGCPASGMSGSGSAVVGIAEDRRHAERIASGLKRRSVVATSRRGD